MKKLALSILLILPLSAQRIPAPEQFFGFKIGADQKLARWDKIVEYFNLVAKQSDRVRVRELGKTYDQLQKTARGLVSLRSVLDTISNGLRVEVRRTYERDLPPPEACAEELRPAKPVS